MNENLVRIIKNDNCVHMQDGEIVVNCADSWEARECEKALNTILNKGESVISMDYMDFASKAGEAKYDFKVIMGMVMGNHSETIREVDLSDDCKYIVCVVGNVSLVDVTNVMDELFRAIGKEEELVASFGFICDENYQEKVFDMYIWKER